MVYLWTMQGKPFQNGLEWKKQGSCVNASSSELDMFFPERGQSSYVKFVRTKFCEGCPVASLCLEYALVNHEWGVWGGTTDRERIAMRKSVLFQNITPKAS